MYKTAKNIIVILFLLSVIIFTLIAILAIWDVFSRNIAWKSLTTLGVLAFSCGAMLIVIKFIEDKGQTPPTIKQ